MPDLIGELTGELQALKEAISDAYDKLAQDEEVWLDKYDSVFELMRDEGIAQGRESDPAEHAVTSAARRKYPAEFRAWRNARREIQRLEEIANSTRTQISAHQTRANQAGRLPTVQPGRRAA